MLKAASSDRPHRILIIRPSALGDVCRSVPVLASLRQAFPDAVIDWIVQSDFLTAIGAHPALTEAVPFPRRELARAWRRPSVTRQGLRWLRGLRERRYDVVYDLQGLGRSGLMSWASRAPRRVGFRDARELAWLGYNVRHDPPSPEVHTVDRMLALLEREGIEAVRDMRLYVQETDRRWWQDRRPQRFAVLAPTARWPSKRWPIGRWRELFEPLLMRGFESIVLIGAPGEEPQVSALEDREHPFLLNLAGKCTIGQTMAVIESAGLLVANDSAPLHMAVGLGTPCLGLFGPTDPAVVGPYQKPHSALRMFRPKPGEIINYRDPKLEDRLMRVISTVAVIQQLDRLLEGQAGAERPRLRQQTQSPPRVSPSAPCPPFEMPLYLASASPRRHQLLNEMDLAPIVTPPDVDDGRLAPVAASPADRVLGLAYLKARRVADRLRSEGVKRGIVLGADTLCVHEGSMLGQARDADDARRMLLAMRNAEHRTITGVCLIDLKNDRRILFHDEAIVRVGDVSDEQIEEYVASGEWRGKAGAYNLIERLDAGWPIECIGDPATVMGLPVKRLRAILARVAAASFGGEAPAATPERAAT